jgi:hypothetical protein
MTRIRGYVRGRKYLMQKYYWKMRKTIFGGQDIERRIIVKWIF